MFNIKHYKKLRSAKKVSKIINSCKLIYDARIINYLKKIDPFVFEELILYTFKKRGYKIYRNKRYTGDSGIDGKVKIDNKLFFIQAKRYQDYINPQHVKDFCDLCNTKKTNGFFIHTGKTGPASKINNENIQIVSGSYLVKFLKYKE